MTRTLSHFDYTSQVADTMLRQDVKLPDQSRRNSHECVVGSPTEAGLLRPQSRRLPPSLFSFYGRCSAE